jgi:hypothetical protein
MRSSQRLTENRPPLSLGAFKPVGHVVAALPDDEQARRAVQALLRAGVDDLDIAQYSAEEVAELTAELSDKVSDFAGFGYEVSLMRRWQELAREGCGWLLVYAPRDDIAARVADVLKASGARMAVKYHTLAVEDLI